MKLIYLKNELKKGTLLLIPFLMVRKELAVLVKVDTWKRRSNPNAVGHPK
jgi:hypothetical protein